MSAVILYDGTFYPLHRAHLYILKSAAEHFQNYYPKVYQYICPGSLRSKFRECGRHDEDVRRAQIELILSRETSVNLLWSTSFTNRNLVIQTVK